MSTHVTCSEFGWRLGNQLFQYAALFAYAYNKGKTIRLNERYKEEHLFKCFAINNIIFQNSVVQSPFKERQFSFNHNLFSGDYDSICGYFQSEKYFDSIKQQLRQQLIFKVIGNNYKDHCFIHVRRMDYLKYTDIHPICTDEYYQNAIETVKKHMGSDTKFVVFSDDIDACRKQYSSFKQSNVSFDTQDAYQTLYSMSTCNSSIIANSSFSWWGAWLSPSIITVAPKNWFGSKGPKDTHDIYCKEWLCL